MPDGSFAAPALQSAVARHDRPTVLAFTTDAASEAALREGLADTAIGIDIRRGNIRSAIAVLEKLPTPKVLIVDVSGDDQPLAALGSLSDVVEPGVAVLVIGESNDMGFYRAITRNLGATDYLAKPLGRDLIGRHFAPVIRGQAPNDDSVTGGRLITVTGVRGGVGASTVAASLAWHFGATLRRHTVLLDADLHQGIAALLLDIDAGTGLATALESPERIDTLLAERVALPAADRLHVLACQSDLARDIVCAPGAAMTLMDTLRHRYNAIVADLPFRPSVLHRELLQAAQHRVLVMTPTLPAIRDTLRLLSLTGSGAAGQRAVVLLNRAGMPGGLNRRQVEDALETKVDVVIPDLPKQVNAATLLGEPAARAGGFKTGILDLAREIGLVRLAEAAQIVTPPKRGGLLGVFRR